jgi:prolyl-tRNA synthetase
MRTRLFLRTAEFLWQEGHTAHATPDEAVDETMKMLGVYATFAEDFMAMPVIRGKKTEGERFPGAVDTYCIEAMMQDRKALQAGTSHFLGQNFSKASNIVFQTKEETREHAWTTSWGVSTRLVGGLVMTHSDDDGLVLPPRLAPAHVVILPVYRGDDTRAKVNEYIDSLAKELRAQQFGGRRIEVEIDARDIRGGDKMWEWVKKGVPLRVEIGPRDVEGGGVMVARRDRGAKDKATMTRADFVAGIVGILDDMQTGLLAKARAYRDAAAKVIDTRAEFDAFFTSKSEKEIHGGFALSHWCGDAKCETSIKDALKVTIRCIPLLDSKGGGYEGSPWAASLKDNGPCIACGKASVGRVVFAKAY